MAGKHLWEDAVRALGANMEDELFGPGGYKQVKSLLSIVLAVFTRNDLYSSLKTTLTTLPRICHGGPCRFDHPL